MVNTTYFHTYHTLFLYDRVAITIQIDESQVNKCYGCKICVTDAQLNVIIIK